MVRLLTVTDLGLMEYSTALERQRAAHAEVVERAASAAAGDARAHGPWPLLLVEHSPPVITVSRRAGARDHLLASAEHLERRGVQVCETDRGGDITWHGPGQLVAYPIVDLRALGLGVHAYIRALEDGVIRACRTWGLECTREEGVTGVWCGTPARKICAIGVRVSRGTTMHGLALNVAPDLSHFEMIVPCGLAGRAATSLEQELTRAPTMAQAKEQLAQSLDDALRDAAAAGAAKAATRPSG